MARFSFSGIFRNLSAAILALACFLPAAHATTYTFFAGGTWSTNTNWAGNAIPPATLTPGDAIVIDGLGACNLDVAVTVPAGATITLNSGKTMVMAGGSLTVEGTFDMNGTLECNTFNSIIDYTNGTINANGLLELFYPGVITSSGSGTFAVGATGAVGMYGDGELVIGGTGTVASGGSISLNASTTALTLGSNATLTSSGTITIGGALNMNPAASTLINESSGIVYINTNTALTGTQLIQNNLGAILIDNAVTLTLGPNAILTNLGAVNGAGTLQMDGTYQGTGSVDAYFTGTGTVMPGNPAGLQTACTSFNGGYSFTGIWEIELEGTGGCADHDQVTSGAASFALGGTLNVTLGASYTPVLPATYIILAATNITGSFSTENLPPVSGATWSIANNGTTLELTLTACTAPDVPVVTASKSHACVVEGTGESITLDVGMASLGGATDWFWYESSCGGISIGTGPTLIVTVSSTTTYYVRGEGGCVGTCGSITITAGDAPTISGVTNSTPTLCSGNIGQFSVAFSGGIGPLNLVYSDGTTNSTVIGYKSDDAVQVTPAVNTTYQIVSITDAFGCQTTTPTTASMVVHPAYTVTLVADGPTSVCNGASTTLKLTAVGSTGPFSYQLGVNASEGPSDGGYTPGTAIIATPGAGDALSVYTISMVSDGNLCSPTTATGSVTITQNTDPAYRVKATATGAGNGLTWADAFPNLHAAFDAQAACPGVSEIWVAAGTYKPERNIAGAPNATNRENTFKLPGFVSILGGFPATGNPGTSDRNASANPTILSGDIGTPGDPADNVYHVVYAPSTTSSASLSGFTIQGGNADNVSIFDGISNGNFYGGGVLMFGEGLSLDSCTLTQNAAAFGGGMTCYSPDGSTPSNPSIVNTTFLDNDATTAGGGLYLLTGSGTGAICSPTLLNCVFELDTSSANGGALYANGMNSGASSPQLINCVFSENLATDDGGAIYLNGSAGGICIASLTNCVFSSNSATSGGAVYGDDATCNLSSATFFNNSATNGGAVYLGNNSISFIQDGIVWANSTPALQSVSSTFNVLYTLNQGGIAGAGNLNTNPFFINSALPKGTDDEWFTNDDGLRISPGSPAQNAANPSTLTPFTDISGLNRIGTFDMGAYEYTACVPLGNATRLYANSSLGTDGLGITWVAGYKNLTNALQMAYDCPQITEMWVAAGTYKPTDKPAGCADCSGGREMAFRIPDQLSIYGGFDNLGTANALALRNPIANPTILSGDIDGNDGSSIYTDNCYHVVMLVNNTSTSAFDGFTLQGGVADDPGFNTFSAINVYRNNGGGIVMYNANTVVQNCVIQNNQATSNGGGVYSTNSGSPTFTECDILNNYAGSFGGGIHINATASTTTVSNCLIASNTSSTMGGGLAFTAGGTYVVEGTVLADNASQQGGGIYADGSSQVVMTNTVLSKNTSGTATNGMVEIINASASATNCTFVATGIAADGVCVLNGPGSSLDVVSSIFWNSGSSILSDVMSYDTVRYSIVQGGYPGIGNSAADPLFKNMGTPKGGDNTWFTTDDGYTLQAGSPAINTGNPLATSPTLDILDVTRTVIFDMGAYEGASLCTLGGTISRLYVNDARASDGDGTTWLLAYKSLGNALKTAYDCPQVTQMWVARGAYYPNRDTAYLIPGNSPQATFRVPSGLSVYGGFVGTEADPALANPAVNKTILSGDIDGNDVNADNNYIAESNGNIAGTNSYHVVRFSNAIAATTLSGLVITAGQATGSGLDAFGGGVYNNGSGAGNSSSPALTNCTLSGNYAVTLGGGMYNNGQGGGSSSPVLTQCTFTGNYASSNGGGMFNYGEGSGGNSSPTLTKCTFKGNSSDHGAALSNNGLNSGISSPTVTNCVFASNSGGLAAGGVINNAESGGTCASNITNCVFWGNYAANVGASMWNRSVGGNCIPSVTNCTFAGNSSTFGAPGIHNQSASPTVTNCIVWGNIPSGSPMYDDGGSSPTVTYSIVELGYTGTGNTITDPLFVNAADPDGADNTWFTTDDGLMLQSGSPAINTSNLATISPVTDILGATRTGIFDRGAYEGSHCALLGASTLLYVDGTVTNDGVGTDWLTAYKSLGNALKKAYDCVQVNEMWVKAGTYTPTLDTAWLTPGSTRQATFRIPSGLALYGGFDGTELLRADKKPVLNQAVLSGDIVIQNDVTDNSYHVVSLKGTTATTLLDGFTIRDGNANVSPETYGGGIITYNNAAFGLNNCVITANHADDNGGGLQMVGTGNLVATNTVFYQNDADGGYGGGAANFEGANTAVHTLTNCVIANNTAQQWTAGMSFSFMNVNLANCTFSGNVATVNSAHNMYVWNTTLNATNLISWSYQPTTAVYLDNSTFTSSYSILSDGITGTNVLHINPFFANESDPDGADDTWFTADDGLKLICASPAENTGTATGTPALDLLAAAANGTKDMGAYERVFATPPARLYVNQSMTGTQAGDTWATAFKELRYALACEAIEPSVTEIWVAAGEYKPTTGTDRTATFALKSGLALYGDFAGTEINLGDRVLNATPFTDLSGDIGAPSDPADDVYHVVTASGVDNTAILNGFRIKHGNATGLGTNEDKGGGMLINGAYPLVESCRIDVNLATNGAGVAIINPGTNAAQLTEVKNCTITQNTASESGGGIYAEQMMVKFTGTTVINSNDTGPDDCE